jgi:hypothetical protein
MLETRNKPYTTTLWCILDSRKTMDKIERIYLGLPADFKKKIFFVGRKFRTNKLSHLPGGVGIVVEYHSGKVLGYDWVKYPISYVNKIFIKYFHKLNKDFEILERTLQLDLIKTEISRLFARFYDENNFETAEYEEVWNSKLDMEMPIEKLKTYLTEKNEAKIDNEFNKKINSSAEFQTQFIKEFMVENNYFVNSKVLVTEQGNPYIRFYDKNNIKQHDIHFAKEISSEYIKGMALKRGFFDNLIMIKNIDNKSMWRFTKKNKSELIEKKTHHNTV